MLPNEKRNQIEQHAVRKSRLTMDHWMLERVFVRMYSFREAYQIPTTQNYNMENHFSNPLLVLMLVVYFVSFVGFKRIDLFFQKL